MRTRYSEDQQAVAEAFADLFARESTPEEVRAAASGCGFDRALWDKLAAAGAMGMALPEELGGGRAALIDMGVVVYEWGRRIAPVPLVEHVVAARALASTAGFETGPGPAGEPASEPAGPSAAEPAGASADDGMCRELAIAAARGDLVATLALRPSEPDGTARLVPAGAAADVVVARRADALVVHRGDPPGAARPNTADLPLADRDLSEASTVANGEPARRRWNLALAEWKALMAVSYAGLADKVLDMGVAYVKQRHQFGVPVGSFQAVQHGLADAATRVEGARLLAFRALCALDADPIQPYHQDRRSDPNRPSDPALDAEQRDSHRLASMALLFSAESARFACDRVLQYHGGYGYSAEYDVQLYYRRAASWLLQLGEPDSEISWLADTGLGPEDEAA